MRIFSFRPKQLCRPEVTLGLMWLAAAPSFAEPYEVPVYQRNQELSVFLRSDPTLTPQGFMLGNYTFYPSLTTDLQYTDNVFSSATDEQGDFILSLNPNFRFQSNFDRHSLDFFFNAEQLYYEKFSTENRLGYDFGSSARYDINDDVFIPLNISYQQRQSSRGNPDDSNVIKPTEYNVLSVESGIIYSGQLLDFDALLDAHDYSYDDAITNTGIQNNQDRNRTETNGFLRLGLSSTTSDLAPYIYSHYRDISYDQRIDDSGFNRSAKEIEGGIGARFRLSSLTTSSLQVGYVSFDPEDSAFDTVRDFSYQANITWEPSTLMAFSLTGTRSIAVTTLNNLAASVNSSINLGATYELTPNIFLFPAVRYGEINYDGLPSAKLETTQFLFGMDYRMNKNVWWNAEYQYTRQDDPKNSPFIGEYDRNTFLLSMRLQF